jgi:hypothetical protein
MTQLGESQDLVKLALTLGTVEIEFASSLTAPMFWTLRDGAPLDTVYGGTLFFLNAGAGVFGVTAAHVVTACLIDSEKPSFVQCMVGRKDSVAYPIHLRHRVIAIHEGLDIATLRFTPEEVAAIGRTVLTGYQRNWPPRLAPIDSWVTFAGWPGVARQWMAPRDISFGAVAMAGKVTNTRETCISIQVERSELAQVIGESPMPEDFDFGGMSGGPMLEIVQRGSFRGWMLAGVIFQGPNPSGDPATSIAGLEIIRARPAHFINVDGTLDVDRWQQIEALSAT